MNPRILKLVLRVIATQFGTKSSRRVIKKFLTKTPFPKFPSRCKPRFSARAFFFLLLFAGLTQTSATWAGHAVNTFSTTMPSSDSVLREISATSEADLTTYLCHLLQQHPVALEKLKINHSPNFFDL